MWVHVFSFSKWEDPIQNCNITLLSVNLWRGFLWQLFFCFEITTSQKTKWTTILLAICAICNCLFFYLLPHKNSSIFSFLVSLTYRQFSHCLCLLLFPFVFLLVLPFVYLCLSVFFAATTLQLCSKLLRGLPKTRRLSRARGLLK